MLIAILVLIVGALGLVFALVLIGMVCAQVAILVYEAMTKGRR